MLTAGQKVILEHLLVLGGGVLIGALYDRPGSGLLVAALAALGWNLRQLLQFEAAMQSKNFGRLRYGDTIWAQMFSRFEHLRRRGKLQKQRYRRLLKEFRKSTNAIPDGAVVVNAQFEIITCNVAARDLAGFRPREDRGQRIDNILRDPAFRDYLKSNRFKVSTEIPSPVHEGEWLSCRLVPYGAAQHLLLIQDITELRRLSAMRREFVANASHELRSPLTVISGYLDTLASDPDAPEYWRRPVEQMQTQALRMNKIVTDLLELSRLEAAGPAPSDEAVDVAKLLNAAKDAVAGRQRLPEIHVDNETGIALHASKAEIESLITNLLSNAIQHTDSDGSITLTWSASEGGAELAVTDTGIGIEKEYLPRLTERFFRVDPGRGREDGGFGLGLAIVKHILERYGAILVVDSSPGSGSRFVCQFPADRLVVASPKLVTSDN